MTLAFNLGMFFRNLQGEEVAFAARSGHCEMAFVGGVEALQEQTDLTRHLSVSLRQGDLLLRIAFEETEDEEPDQAEVDVRLVQLVDGAEHLLAQSAFRFREVSLKPAGEADEEPPPPEAG